MFSHQLLLLLSLNIVILPVLISSADSQSIERVAAKRPAPPRRIPPNKVKPGGGLDFSLDACQSKEDSLIALVPVDNPVLTTQPYPSFLFYIPDPASAISHGEFALFSADEKTRLYSTEVTFDSTPGIIKIDIPASAQSALETETPYHWYFKLYCSSENKDSQDSGSQSFLDVDGWIKRVPLTPTRAEQVAAASPDIWYDAIAKAAQDLIAAPEDPAVRARWLNLLQYIEREQLSEVGIGSVTERSTTE